MRTASGTELTGAEIRTSIRQRLDNDGRGRLSHVKCSLHQGKPVLWGHVATVEDRWLAICIVLKCPGMTGVVNRIQLTDSVSVRRPVPA